MPSRKFRSAFLRLRKLMFGLSSSLRRRALCQGVGASIEHAIAFPHDDFLTVIDVGASRGQFSLFSRSAFPRARIISFEPLPAAVITFRHVFRQCAEVVVYPLALAAAKGSVKFHVAEDDDSSSVLRVGPRQSQVFGTREATVIEVETARLDEILGANDIARPSLLKIDVQGYEDQVLHGCGQLLELFDAVYIEGSFIELYQDQALLDDILPILGGAGFCLRGVFNQAHDLDGSPVQADFLFRRVSHRPPANLTPN